MPLQDGHTYAIRNELTHTVLDLTGNTRRRLFVMGWGWNNQNRQKWRAIRVGDLAHNKWKLQNQRSYDDQLRFLSPQLEDAQPDKNYRLVGGILPCEFVIQEIGATGTYRILYGERAVSLVTGEEVHKIEARDVLLDLHANGTPIALQPWAENPAQIWLFHDTAANFPADEIWEPLADAGAYKIVNSKTGTILGIVTENVGNPVHALVSKGGNHHKWIVTRDPARAEYTFKSSANDTIFLAPDVARPENGTALIGGAAHRFLVRKVPDSKVYKIFLRGSEEFTHLAVNVAVVDGEPDSAHGAVVSLQTAEAQEWHFIQVPL